MKKYISLLLCLILLAGSLRTLSFAAGTVRSSVDARPDGVYNRGTDTLCITGWAFDTGGSVVRCCYKIDNSERVFTDPVIRNDVVRAYPDTCSQYDCGFNQEISTDGLSFGSHTFSLYAVCGNDEVLLCESVFTVAGIRSDCNQIPSGAFDVENTENLRVVGWAFNVSGEETDCFYQIDDGERILMPRKNRSDVQTVFGCTQLDCGFFHDIPVSEFTVGSHTLRLIAVSGTCEKTVGSSEVEIKSETSKFKYSADYYLSGTYTYGSSQTVHLGGWAFNTDGFETRCYCRIDNGAPVMMTPGNRPDVVTAYPDECTQYDCGYTADISIADLGKGVHTYRVIAKCSRVSEVVKESRFTVVGTNGTLKSHSDRIPEGTYALSDESSATVQGWGYNTSGEETKFYGRFDGGREFYLKTEERSDVYAAESGCFRSDCGYRQKVYLGNLSQGSHTFSVVMKSGELTQVVRTSTFAVVKPVYSVCFDANGGTGAPAPAEKIFGKNLILPSDVPTREYYEFKGWNTSADGKGERVEESYKNNSDVVLYAQWKHEKIELMPGSLLRYDARTGLVYGEELSSITAEELLNNFSNTNKSVSCRTVVTGTEISVSDADGVYDTAQTVILGDIDCDGRINGTDAVIAECIACGMLDEAQLGKARYSASDCVRNGITDGDDVLKLTGCGVMSDTVDQNAVSSRGYYDTEFNVAAGETTDCSITFNGRTVPAQIDSQSGSTVVVLNADCGSFNYFGLKYSCTTYAGGTVVYKSGDETRSEKFFLEPGENKEFFSFIENVFENSTGDTLVSLSFVPVNSDSFDFTVSGISVFLREVPDTVTYIQNESIRIGLNMEWGGSLSYYEDLDSHVQAVSDSGIIRIDSSASEKYNSELLNGSVNLINCHDTGRLVQQSYYGTRNYEMGFFNGHYCAYNPVQGGNMYNEESRIIDLRTGENTVYVKCQPLDWAKEKEYITESYMEATYTLCGDVLKTQCRFVDFSGYDSAFAGQEIPAFYGAATMDKFVYYGGDSPWTGGELSTLENLDEYPYAQYPSVRPSEHWGALTGESEDSFSIGLYVPASDYMLAGVYGCVTAQTENPDVSDPTSYLAGGKQMLFQSFEPIEYEFYIATGTVEGIRNRFGSIAAGAAE